MIVALVLLASFYRTGKVKENENEWATIFYLTLTSKSNVFQNFRDSNTKS